MTPLFWLAAHTPSESKWHRDHADACSNTGDDRNDRRYDRPLTAARVPVGNRASGRRLEELAWRGYGKLLTRTREYVDILRTILKRERALDYHGEYSDIPARRHVASANAQVIVHPLRPDIPIYLAANRTKECRACPEIADGWLAGFFSPKRVTRVSPVADEGFARRKDGKTISDFDIAPTVSVVIGDDVNACRMHVKPNLALYIGGMGAAR